MDDEPTQHEAGGEPAGVPLPPPPPAGPLVPPPPPSAAPAPSPASDWVHGGSPWADRPRPRIDTGSIVGRTFDTLGREWSLFLALAIPAALGAFASGVASDSVQAIARDPAAGGSDPIGVVLEELLIALLTGLTTIATVVATDRLWRGEAVGLGDSIRRGVALLPRALGLLLVVLALALGLGVVLVAAGILLAAAGPGGVLVGLIGALGLVVVLIAVGARLSLVLPVLAFEGTPVLDVIGRTWRLTRGHALLLLLTAIVVALCGLLPSWGATLFSLFVEDRLIAAIALGLATLVTAPLSGIWCVLAWGDLTGGRHRDTAVMARGRGRTTGILLVVGVGLILLMVGGALAATGSEELLRQYG
jgi:hypothetical protein